MKKYLGLALLVFAIIIAVATRSYMLGEAPHGLYLDEAGQGYSAYSILKTGKDEFGKEFPVVFRNFLDFKTPVYIYMLVPLIPVFGLTKFTVRFPSFFFSILTFPFLYLLIKNLLPEKSKINPSTFSGLATLLLAISPWHILFGRTNFEVNVSLFFLIAGLYYFYRAIGFKDYGNKKKHKPTSLVWTALMFAIAIPAYHSQRVVTPLMMLALAIYYRKTIFQIHFRKAIIIGSTIGLLISIPTMSVMTTPGFLKRASGLNIFTNERTNPAGYLENYDGIFEPIINNRLFLSTKEFASLYTSYFSPRNMYILGDSGPRSSFPALSTFFLWQLPFYVCGFYILIKKKDLGDFRFLVLTLLFISPIPAAVTRDPYSTIRALVMVIPQLIVTAIGLYYTYEFAVKRMRIKNLKKYFDLSLIPLVFVVLLYSLAKLWSSVIILNEHFRAKYWNYGWQEVTETIQTLDNSLPIIVDNARTEPYSQLLFFLKFNPATYQNENFEVSLDEYYTNLTRNKEKKIGNIVTRPIDWDNDTKVEQYLIGDALAISDKQIEEHNLELIRDITYPDWSTAFRVVKNSINNSSDVK